MKIVKKEDEKASFLQDKMKYIYKTELIMSLLLLITVGLIACKMPTMVKNHETKQEEEESESVKARNITVIVDPGHGGVDPGKIGVNKVNEKEINLAISFILKEELEAEGFDVVMTRMDDTGLYAQTDKNKKRADMFKRVEIINNEYANHNETINISIHQNSYTSESVKGPQVFYYSKSENGKKLATILQNTINTELKIERPRTEKVNDQYYMLVKTNCPSVIVECGFLSNYEEAEKLNRVSYQREMAKALVKGIVAYYTS